MVPDVRSAISDFLLCMEKKLVANGGYFKVGHKFSMADIGVSMVLEKMSTIVNENFSMPKLSSIFLHNFHYKNYLYFQVL